MSALELGTNLQNCKCTRAKSAISNSLKDNIANGDNMPLIERTALRDRCGAALTCPAVFEETTKKSLLIIGAKVAREDVNGRVGTEETAIEIDKGLVTRALAGPVSRLFMRVGL
jgi:hypothetical protein